MVCVFSMQLLRVSRFSLLASRSSLLAWLVTVMLSLSPKCWPPTCSSCATHKLLGDLPVRVSVCVCVCVSHNHNQRALLCRWFGGFLLVLVVVWALEARRPICRLVVSLGLLLATSCRYQSMALAGRSQCAPSSVARRSLMHTQSCLRVIVVVAVVVVLLLGCHLHSLTFIAIEGTGAS